MLSKKWSKRLSLFFKSLFSNKPLILGIIGIIQLSIAAGIIIGNTDFIPSLYYQINPPVYKIPPEEAKITSAKLLDLINKEREQKGLKPFKEDRTLTYIAYLRAKDILDNQEFSHQATRSGMRYNVIANKIGYFYKEIKENLAMGYETEEQIIEAWKKSQKHAENLFITDNFEVGIYSKDGNLYGKAKTVTALILGKEQE